MPLIITFILNSADVALFFFYKLLSKLFSYSLYVYLAFFGKKTAVKNNNTKNKIDKVHLIFGNLLRPVLVTKSRS